MKEGNCDGYPEDGRDGRRIGINRIYNNRAKKKSLSKREREREMRFLEMRNSRNSDGLASL